MVLEKHLFRHAQTGVERHHKKTSSELRTVRPTLVPPRPVGAGDRSDPEFEDILRVFLFRRRVFCIFSLVYRLHFCKHEIIIEELCNYNDYVTCAQVGYSLELLSLVLFSGQSKYITDHRPTHTVSVFLIKPEVLKALPIPPNPEEE